VPSCHNYAVSLLAKQVNQTSCLAPLLALIVNGGIYLRAPTLIGALPRFVPGGLLFCIGCEVLREWAVESRRRIAQNEWVTLLVIALFMVAIDLISGIFIGLLLSMFFCAVEYNSITGIVAEDRAGHAWSHVERPSAERQHLMDTGEQVRIFWLEGYLFFGSASSIIEQLQEKLKGQVIRYVILDMSRVPAVDASGVFALLDLADALPAQILLCGMVRRLRLAFSYARAVKRHQHEELGLVRTYSPGSNGDQKNSAAPFLDFSNVDAALEYAENELLLAAPGLRPSNPLWVGSSSTVRRMLEAEFGEEQEELCAALESSGELLEGLQRGAQLCVEGEDACCVYFLVSGAVSSVMELSCNHMKPMDTRHLNLEKGDTFVEVGFRFRQRKFVDRGVLGIMEFAAGLPRTLVTAEVVQKDTRVFRVSVERLRALFLPNSPAPVSPEARQAFLKWTNAKLVSWITAENAKVRELTTLSRSSRDSFARK